ncbi:MAG: SGNH/GDSL hydrolase family protein, partial [Candidatus Binatia bacterium]
MTPSRRRTRLVLRLAGVCLLTLAVLEGFLRLYHRFDPMFFFPSASYNRFRGAPHSQNYDFRLNSLGLKDVEFSQRKRPGVFRIVAIGDSVAFGVVPYEHNFLTLLERRLRRKHGDVELLNFGINGLSVVDYLAVLRNEAVAFDPDLVVVFFFVGNDFFPRPDAEEEPPASYLFAFARALVRI